MMHGQKNIKLQRNLSAILRSYTAENEKTRSNSKS